jgi:hypothetical protein
MAEWQRLDRGAIKKPFEHTSRRRRSRTAVGHPPRHRRRPPDPLLRPAWGGFCRQNRRRPAGRTAARANPAAGLPPRHSLAHRRAGHSARAAVRRDRRARPVRRACRRNGEIIRDGLVARMALAEASGWLAHAHVWVHPLDLDRSADMSDAGRRGHPQLARLARNRRARLCPHGRKGSTPKSPHKDSSCWISALATRCWWHATMSVRQQQGP